MNQWLEAQNGCIGSVLIRPRLAPELLAECTEEDFSDNCRELFIAIKKLVSAGEAVDAITLNTATDGKFHDWIYQLIEITPTAENFRFYVQQAKEKAATVRLQSHLMKAANAGNLEQMRAALDEANAAMVTSRKATVGKMEELVMDFYQRKQKQEVYLTTGMPFLDRYIFLNRGDFGFIGGYPSRGKTSLALQLAASQARKYRVGFFSLETNSDKIMDRLICQTSYVPMQRIKRTTEITNEDWDHIGTAAAYLSKINLEVIEAAGMTVDDIFRVAIANRYEIIYIDYLQIIQGAWNSSRYETVTDISIRLHTLAQKNKITVIALSQLSRNNNEATEEPQLSSLRESGQLEQDADFILFVYCTKKNDTAGNRNLKIAKNKEGSTGIFEMYWNGNSQTMEKITHDSPPGM